MGIGAVIVLLVAALVLGFVAQSLGHARFGYEWVIAGIAAAIGAYVASEWLGTMSTWGPEWDGMFLLPALIGALVLGGLVETITRMTAGPARV